MGSTIWAYFQSFLPRYLRTESAIAADPKVIREINLLSLGLIFLVFIIFASTYYVSIMRFDPSQNSLHMPAWFIGVLAWGGISGLIYYGLDVNKSLPYILPGVIVGGGLYLGVTTFALESSFPGIAIEAGLAAFSTVLFAQVLNFYRVLDRYVWLESGMVAVGSILMNVILIYAAYVSGLSGLMKVPAYMDPVSFYAKIIFVSLSVTVLMSFLALFHLDHIRKVARSDMTFMEKLHLAANALFVVFFLYTAFMFLFAAGRSKK